LFNQIYSIVVTENLALLDEATSQNYSLRPRVHKSAVIGIRSFLVISLTVTLSCGCYLETFVSIILCNFCTYSIDVCLLAALHCV